MLNSKSIGERIAKARRKTNLSQAELAQKVAISSQAVGKWERGESLPDIITLNRLSEILAVDLNYFSENYQAGDIEDSTNEEAEKQLTESLPSKKKPGWDMSKLNLTDSDFSDLKNLQEKLSSSNIQRCLFIGADLSGLLLKRNNVDSCDFSGSDFSCSHIQNSFLNKNKFNDCTLKESEFTGSDFTGCDFSGVDFNKLVSKSSYFSACDFSGADLKNAAVKSSGFEKSIMTGAVLNNTSFIGTQLADIVFEGFLEDCSFEDCAFTKVKFQNATLTNTFFKNNKKFKRVQFINCKVDKLTYAFLKNNLADLTGVTLIS